MSACEIGRQDLRNGDTLAGHRENLVLHYLLFCMLLSQGRHFGLENVALYCNDKL